jgi:simple sugar transport system permease protein
MSTTSPRVPPAPAAARVPSLRRLTIERRLRQPRWLSVAVPVGSLVVAFGIMALVLVATGHDPWETYKRLFESAFTADGALTTTVVSATPLLFTGLAAAAAFRMQLFNIGGEGQLYLGAIAAAAAGLYLGDHGWPSPLVIAAMCVGGAAAGAGWALIPGVFRAFLSTNEIITSLMLNYVAFWLLNYLIFGSQSYWRDTSTPEARVFPQGKTLPDSATWPSWSVGDVVLPLGFLIGLGLAAGLWTLYQRTRFGFELQVIADSPRAARYAGMRTRRKILAVMAISGALAGIGGASQDGDFRHQLDARGLQQANYGYTGIVIAALARYNPFAVCLVAFLLGGLQNAGYTLQGADFPSGLVGVMQGIILFCALGGELLIRYRVRLRPAVQATTA